MVHLVNHHFQVIYFTNNLHMTIFLSKHIIIEALTITSFLKINKQLKLGLVVFQLKNTKYKNKKRKENTVL